MWGCRDHWFTLPKYLRDKIWAAYVPGQEITKTPSAAYIAAAHEVQQWIKDYLERNTVKVSLIRYTPDALQMLVGTKTTRLRGKKPEDMSEAELYDAYKYMLDTIRSPFDFVDYIFNIEGVSKNMTHQLVRTRAGAYQQESSRAVEVNEIVQPDKFLNDETLATIWHDAVADAEASYKELLSAGADLQDARAILPSNFATNIQAKFSLRTLSDMAKVRLCVRTGGEYQNAFRLMREEVLKVHPWADPLIQVSCVATGQCAFPRYGREKCTFYRPWMDLRSEQEELRKVFWATPLQTNNPVATGDGKSAG
jgi:flavin-dependent thymidylate synthase